MIAALSEKFKKEVTFLLVDVGKDDDPSVVTLAKEFEIQYIPTIIFIDSKGQFVKKQVGPISEQELTKEIEQLIN